MIERTRKRCPTRCEPNQTLPAASFFKNPSRADGLSSQCRECHHTVQRAYYSRNVDAERARTRRRARRVRPGIRKRVLQYLETHPCVDGGEDNPLVLEFHHVRGPKLRAVSLLAAGGYDWEVVEAEIAKCIVVCANSHKVRTAAQRLLARRSCQLQPQIPPRAE